MHIVMIAEYFHPKISGEQQQNLTLYGYKNVEQNRLEMPKILIDQVMPPCDYLEFYELAKSIQTILIDDITTLLVLTILLFHRPEIKVILDTQRNLWLTLYRYLTSKMGQNEALTVLEKIEKVLNFLLSSKDFYAFEIQKYQ